jgi:hypothetical protein
MEDIPADGSRPDEMEFINEVFDVETSSPDAIEWRGALLNVLAKYNFCKVIQVISHRTDKYGRPYVQKYETKKGTRSTFVTARTSKFHIIGQPHNVEIVKGLYFYLSSNITKHSRNAWKIRRASLSSSIPKNMMIREERIYKKSFRIGAVNAISERFQAQRREDINSNPNVNALVVKADKNLLDAVDKFLNGAETRTTINRNKTLDFAAYHSGVEHGKSLKIQEEFNTQQKAIGSSKKVLALNA